MTPAEGGPLLIDNIESFARVREVEAHPGQAVLASVAKLDEREELEPFIRDILADSQDTPHGPAELVDIFTHKLRTTERALLSAFILKGRSSPRVRPKDISHQIYRLEKIAGLQLAVLGAVGTVLDQAKEQFISTARRIGCRYTLLDSCDLARLFVAYGFLCPRDGQRIVGGRCVCGYRPNRQILNDFQREALREFRTSIDLGQRSGLVVLPTGSGKTRIAAKAAKAIKADRVLYVAHTHEILDVAVEELEAEFSSQDVLRLLTRDDLTQRARVWVATVQLLARHLALIESATFDLLIVDEFHHAAASTYRELINSLSFRFLLGLTATPFRGDRQDIVDLCGGNVLVNFDLVNGINQGILCPYHYYGCFDSVDYTKIGRTNAGYSIRDLERALIIPERDAAILAKWNEKADGRPTLAFCCSHRHAQRVAGAFQADGVPAEVYISDTDHLSRRRLLQRLKSGDLKVLCVVDVLNEGVDVPFVECLLFLRPTESKRIFFQQLGRGLRRYVGKSYCLVIDFIGNFSNAYRVLEYQSLRPDAEAPTAASFGGVRCLKDILNLPQGCRVEFDERVVDLFVTQFGDARQATRSNIGKILLYQYSRLSRRLGRKPTRRELDRTCLLDSSLYALVFGSWAKFERLVRHEILF